MRNDAVQETTFDAYPLLRLADAPLIDHAEHPLGLGEAGVPGAAVANVLSVLGGDVPTRMPLI